VPDLLETMSQIINPDKIYRPSPDVVAREIEGELLIIPLFGGVGNMEDELLTLNGTGRLIWERLDGVKSLSGVARELAVEYPKDSTDIDRDVVGFVGELVKRKLVVEVADA